MFSDQSQSPVTAKKRENPYGMLARRKPLVKRPKRDPLSQVRSHFVIKRIQGDDGNTQLIVLQQETYGAVIFQRNRFTDEIEIDHRPKAREAIERGDFDYFDNLAQIQAQADAAEEISTSLNLIPAA